MSINNMNTDNYSLSQCSSCERMIKIIESESIPRKILYDPSRSKLDYFLTARNTQSAWSLGLSFFSTGIGCWILCVAPDIGAKANFWGAMSYSLSCSLPYLVMIPLGIKVKRALGDGTRGFTLLDFVFDRYGYVIKVLVTIASLLFMFIFFCAELISLIEVLEKVIQSKYSVTLIGPILLLSMMIFAFGGMSCVILTDKIHSIILFILTCFTITPILQKLYYSAPSEKIYAGVFLPSKTYFTFITLPISVVFNQFLDQSMWQKVFAAQSNNELKKGLIIGASLTFPIVFIFTFIGKLIYNVFDEEIKLTSPSNISLLQMVNYLDSVWLCLLAIFSVLLAFSTISSIQCGVAGLAGSYIPKYDGIHWHLIVIAIMGIAGAALALQRLLVLELFLLSNILSCALMPPIFLSFWPRITSLASFCGIMCGILTISLCGYCFTNDLRSIYNWFVFLDNAFDYKVAITFMVVPILTTVITIGLSYIHTWINPKLVNKNKNILESYKKNIGNIIV